jgi:DNA invertase Pin-like site-specific DNA recombinase
MQIGYARISTEDQSLALQTDALRHAGCELIFQDEGISGIATSRPALDKALAALAPGDVLVTWKLDWLGRSLAHLIDITVGFAARDIGFRSLSEAIDTTTASGRLLFHVMGALAEFERALISERTRAGMAASRARGAQIGRPRKLSDEEISAADRLIEAGIVSLEELAASSGVAPVTLARALKRRLAVVS